MVEDIVNPDQEPEQEHELRESGVMNEDMLKRAQAEQEAIEQRMAESMVRAGKTLTDRLKEDKDLQRLAYMMLFSNRLFNWAIAEACSLKGISSEMATILVKAQQEKSSEAFSFPDMVKDFQEKQMPWLESRSREARVRQNRRTKRLKEFASQLRRKNIELPCHSMEALFDNNFTHEDILVVVGEKRAVVPVLQLCARKYTKTGGSTVLLSSNEVAPQAKHIASQILRPQVWRNAAAMFGDMKELLEGYSRQMKPMGLLVVEDLDNMLMMSPVMQSRQQYLLRSQGMLRQYQADYGGAMILGVFTDDDPRGMDRIQIYPPPILSKHVFVSWQEPLVSDIPSIVVGNDILLMSDIQKKLAKPK